MNLFTLFSLLILLIVTSCTSVKNQIPNEVTKISDGHPILDVGELILPDCQNYSVEEFIAKGIATSYKEVSKQEPDGKWLVEANTSDTASYTTRILVMKPKETDKFNGKVLVEWINVSGGFDYTPARLMMWRELIRSGWAWVGVSAQKVGIEGGKNILSVLICHSKKPILSGTDNFIILEMLIRIISFLKQEGCLKEMIPLNC